MVAALELLSWDGEECTDPRTLVTGPAPGHLAQDREWSKTRVGTGG